VSSFFRAEIAFLTPEEGGRSEGLHFDFGGVRPYEALLNFGFGYTEDGYSRRAFAYLEPDKPESYSIDLGDAYVLRVGSTCPEEYVAPGAEFTVSEGPKVVARGTVIERIEV
jgi:hypothetical protein